MKISVEKIFQFHHLRTQAHIDCLNYFAGLLGYHFPEHDNDKNHDTICTGYAYYNWARYHPEFTLSPAHRELHEMARREHHHTQPHHVWYYSNTVDIDDVTLVEMVCDWHSASFEQRFITHEDPLDYDVRTFFEKNMLINPKLHWTNHQIELINNMIDFLEMYAEHDTILKIWLPLLDY